MMRLPPFRYHAPRSVDEAAAILAAEGPKAMVLGGGTDLFPNMKRRQQVPEAVVSLRRIAPLHATTEEAGALTIGAAVTLTDLVGDARLSGSFPALHRAAAQVATPHLRNSATLGGNVCLDTRCNYYDQTYEWREAIGFCMKKDGDTCWVATSSPKCLAVSSTDCAPALIALRADVTLVSAGGRRRVAVEDLYQNDGMNYLLRRPDEVLAAVHVPSSAGWRSTYWKLRRRGSIDFPVLGVAAALRLGTEGVVEEARIVLGAVASRPLVATEAAAALIGKQLSDAAIDEASSLAAKLAKPMDNADFTLHWRKQVVRPYVAGALKCLRGDDPSTFTLLQRRAARAVDAVAF